MKAFAALYAELDETTKTGEKVDALARYFAAADPADAAWAVHFLSGRRPKRLIGARKLAAWAMEAADVPEWLFAECYESVGDLAETISLLLPASGASSDLPLRHWVEERLLPLRGEDEESQRRVVERAWAEMDGAQAYVWNKLITGSFRVGVSQSLVVRSLSRLGGVEEAAVAHRMMGAWDPTPEFYLRLLHADTRDADLSRPYPFFLAYALEAEPETLGEAAEWQAEWKWDGIRAQVIRRAGATFIWSRGEELITERFPELAQAAALLPDGTVLDGEIMPWRDGPLPFAQLQRRIGRKVLGAKILAEVPVVLLTYDLLEDGGIDIRERPLSERRARLEEMIRNTPSAGRFLLSPIAAAESWDDVMRAYADARGRAAEGLMLKKLDAPYGVGRRKGGWWKWKVEPFTLDAVLIYAQRGHGRRASLYSDYTFGVWKEGELVPFAKAYSGLTDEEIRKVDSFVRRNTTQRFGPVRTVKPELVFELAFEGIQRSPRHKSGVAVRFPRMLRWRTDKRPEDADSLETIWGLIEGREAEQREQQGIGNGE
ncbi:ATP-dependent DNA ligase [Longimicrobium terrae]|uniref:DNA ligase (ATP) n=1 Tax=Longimicrobium terrae TaxID=1639882 RepID=A0A841H5N6_9BACT|nr:DNA ligase-1 [Longimicrobium terrae]MBB6073288.1 DNA ligase-1 [Longimicrobium terrae]NNC28729.1 ATP-dependent DNA ligase [Longimicrobium terrae]